MQVRRRVVVSNRRRSLRIGRAAFLASASACLGLVACSQDRRQAGSDQPVSIPPGVIIAVAPAINASGSSAFDPVVVGDLMASELTTVPGIGVVGVNRVMAILADQGHARIQSPQQAVEICDRLGADAILVFAVTEYNAYTPVVGLTGQLYGRSTMPVMPTVVPENEPPPAGAPLRPLAQAQKVFNATHESVQNEVRDYADKRKAGGSPYGWRQYLVSQEAYLRFCCYRVAEDLLGQSSQVFGFARLAGCN